MDESKKTSTFFLLARLNLHTLPGVRDSSAFRCLLKVGESNIGYGTAVLFL